MPRSPAPSEPLACDAYLRGIGDEKLVLDLLVGDLRRVIEYPRLGCAIEQEVPEDVRAAYESLRRDGRTGRLVATPDRPARFTIRWRGDRRGGGRSRA